MSFWINVQPFLIQPSSSASRFIFLEITSALDLRKVMLNLGLQFLRNSAVFLDHVLFRDCWPSCSGSHLRLGLIVQNAHKLMVCNTGKIYRATALGCILFLFLVFEAACFTVWLAWWSMSFLHGWAIVTSRSVLRPDDSVTSRRSSLT